MPEHKTPDTLAQNSLGESISQPPNTPQKTDQTNHPNEQKSQENNPTPQAPESDSPSNTSSRNNHKIESSTSGNNKKKKNYTKRKKSKPRRARTTVLKYIIKYTPPQKAKKPKNNKKIKLITIFAVLLGSHLIIRALDYIANNISQIAKVLEEWKLVSIPLTLTLFASLILFAGPKIFTGLQKIIMKLTNKYFISSLACFAFIGAASALLIPAYTNWFKPPEFANTQHEKTNTTNIESETKPTSNPSSTENKSEDKKTNDAKSPASDLRLHLLYITGGIIAILSLIETNRKNSLEHSRQTYAARRDRYIEAVDKLSSEHAPVRLGGVYALIALIDEWLADETLEDDTREREGQVIINNLCAYIRSPFPLAAKASHFTKNSISITPTNQYQKFKNKLTKQNTSFSDDQIKFTEEKEIRQIIFKELSLRIASKNHGPSENFKSFIFNFEGSPIFYSLKGLNFINANFSKSTFYGKASFEDAKFYAISENSTDFSGSIFTESVNFSIATFWGSAKFIGAVFQKGADFSSCHFEKRRHSYDDAPFDRVTTITIGYSYINSPKILFRLPLGSVPFYQDIDNSYDEGDIGMDAVTFIEYKKHLLYRQAYKIIEN